MFMKACLDCRLRRTYHLESVLDLGWCWKGFFLPFFCLTIKMILPSPTFVIFVWSFRHFGVLEPVSVWSLLKFLLSLGWFCFFFSSLWPPLLVLTSLKFQWTVTKSTFNTQNPLQNNTGTGLACPINFYSWLTKLVVY